MKTAQCCKLCEARSLKKPLAQNLVGVAFFEEHPTSAGRVLVVPHRHVDSLEALSYDEQMGFAALADAAARRLQLAHSGQYRVSFAEHQAAGKGHLFGCLSCSPAPANMAAQNLACLEMDNVCD